MPLQSSPVLYMIVAWSFLFTLSWFTSRVMIECFWVIVMLKRQSEVPKITHQAYGLRALVNSGRPEFISPGYWENQIGRFHYQNEMHKHNEHNYHGSLSLHSDSDSEHDEHKEGKNYVELKITVNVYAFSKLNFIYTSELLLDDASTINYLRSKGLHSDNTLIVSPGPYVNTKPQYLNNLTFTFPPNVLLPRSSPTRKGYHRNPLQINAEPTDVEKATTNDFANWMKWPKKIIDLPPDIKPWLDFNMAPWSKKGSQLRGTGQAHKVKKWPQAIISAQKTPSTIGVQI
ncbi:hypothetical protein F5876DRAFT_69210 [Lentinula aff. lateritia]|uniref:Uncharacterized protein n=1 Tax=Lentinula aff. lateritia TaxID=2804960 RepID=A0ACC1TMY3_9AGAR|nr:hypothetical protein F5876DRAFT_69210 [Lentinula aff. lateritia]